MKLITKDTDYAVRALIYLRGNKARVVSVSELVDNLKIPRPFLRKIMQTLTNGGIVNSQKGKQGGFKLALTADKILLVELRKIFQGKFKLTDCFFKKDACRNFDKCLLKKKILSIEKYVAGRLSAIRIADL